MRGTPGPASRRPTPRIFATSNTAPLRSGLARLWLARRVLSSALHGVILAHAYGIPALPVRIGDGLVGGDFKFRDHYHSIGHAGFRARVSFSDLVGRGAPAESVFAAVDGYWQPEGGPPSTARLLASFPVPEDVVEAGRKRLTAG